MSKLVKVMALVGGPLANFAEGAILAVTVYFASKGIKIN